MGSDLPAVTKGGGGAGDQRLVGYRTDALLFEAVLGSGAMGVVYRGRQVRLDRVVAIKVIAAHLAGDPSYVDRFDREARTLARLHHPHIVACYDFGPLPGPAGETLLIMVMEFVDGCSLGDLLKARPMGVRAVLELHRQAAEGLAAAHHAGVVHRDIKPDNIMVTADGSAKITDFGLAKSEDNAALTQVGLLMGTPAYMAPEVCAGGAPTPSSDLYSLGCGLYSALVGEVPYPSPSTLESIQLHLRAPVPSIAERRPELTMLDALLRRLLAKQPAERCASAQVLAKELATLVALVPEQLMCGRRPAKSYASSPDVQTVMQSAATLVVPADKRPPPSRRTVSQLLPVVKGPVAPALAAAVAAVPAAPPPPPPVAAELPSLPPAAALPVPPASTRGEAKPARAARKSDVLAFPFPVAGEEPPPAEPEEEVAHTPTPTPVPALPVTVTGPATAERRKNQRIAVLRESADHLRQSEAKEGGAEGDRLLAAGRLLAAATTFELAARALPAGELRHALLDKAERARQEHGRRRLRRVGIGLMLGIALVGGGAAVLWRTGVLARLVRQVAPALAAAQDQADDNGPHVVERLARQVDDTAVPWPAILEEAGRHAAQGGPDMRVFAALRDRAQHEVTAMSEAIAAIDGLAGSDPATALARSLAFRADHPRAGTLAQRLPLPGRLQISGAPVGQLDIRVAGARLPGAALVVFCRHADTPTAISIAAPGFHTVTLEVPPDPAEAERLVPVTMREAPLWALPAGSGTGLVWAQLLPGPAAAPGTVVVAGPEGLRLVRSADGNVLASLDRTADPAIGEASFSPLVGDEVPGRAVIGTSNGLGLAATVDARGFSAVRVVRRGAPAVALAERDLVLRLGQRAVFAIERERGSFTLVAASADRQFWQKPLNGALQPWFQARDDGLLVIDDFNIHALSQEGEDTAAVLPARRSGAVAPLEQGRILVVATTAGVGCWRTLSGKPGFEAITGIGELSALQAVALAGDGKQLLSADASGALRLWTLQDGVAQPVWSVALPAGRSFAPQLALAGGSAICVDDQGTIRIVDCASHAVVRTIDTGAPLATTPRSDGGCLIVVDAGGEVDGYALVAPVAAP